MKAIDALYRFSGAIKVDDDVWLDDDRDYFKTVLRALSEMADREAAQAGEGQDG